MVRATTLHRVFIQSLLSRRFMREETALELYRRAVDVLNTVGEPEVPRHALDSAGLSSFMQELSTLLHDFGMEVKRGREETKSGKLWYALVNNEAQGAGAFASDYTPIELTYFREIVGEILDSYPAYSIGKFQALRLASLEEVKLTKSAAQSLLRTFVARGYLVESRRGRFALGPRGVLELETYLNKEGNVTKCHRCKKPVFVGKACSNGDCGTHFHLYCCDAVVRRGPTCPRCRGSFDDNAPKDIGEAAVSRAEDDYRELNRKRKRSSRGGRTQGTWRGDYSEGSDEEEEDDHEEEDRTHSQAQGDSSRAGPSRRVAASQGRRNRPSVVPETQLDEDD